MIVAAGAPHGQAEKRLRRGGNHVIDHLQTQPIRIGFLVEPGADGEKGRRGDLVHLRSTLAAGWQQIAGKLLGHKLVVRLIVVECVDDIIAIGLIPTRVCHAGEIDPTRYVAGNIEPVPAPFFPIVRRGEKPIDQLLIRIRRRIGKKRPDLLWPRRKTKQIKRRPANERAFVGLGSGF